MGVIYRFRGLQLYTGMEYLLSSRKDVLGEALLYVPSWKKLLGERNVCGDACKCESVEKLGRWWRGLVRTDSSVEDN